MNDWPSSVFSMQVAVDHWMSSVYSMLQLTKTFMNAMQVVVNASTEGQSVGSTTGFVGQAFPLLVPQPHLWSFEDPFLYDLDVTILSGRNSDGKTVSPN